MADKKISELTAIDALANLDEFPVNDVSAADNRKVTGSQLLTYVQTAPSQPLMLLYTKSVANITSGAPADIATLSVPSGVTRYRVTGTTAAQSFHAMITETQTGTPAAGTMAVFDQASGQGNQVMATTAPPAGGGTMANWASSSASAVLSSSTLSVRQMVNSANSATISFYVMIEPLP
jgi:hypothetical protein